MLEALRTGDPERINEYSDLCVPRIDQRILDLTLKLDTIKSDEPAIDYSYGGSEQAQRLHNILVGMDFKSSELLKPFVERACKQYPDTAIHEIIPIVLGWCNEQKKIPAPVKVKQSSIKLKIWHTLDSDDLRFMHSQSNSNNTVYDQCKNNGLIFDYYFYK